MVQPVVSVVIPAFNGSAYLQACVQSVVAQDVPCEIIVVDDGSTDDSVERARAIMRQQAVSMRVLCQRNQGPAAARNAGLQLAQGRYVCFLDVDDEYLPGFFATALQVLESEAEIVAVTCPIEFVDLHRPVEAWQVNAMEHSIPGNLIVRTTTARQVGGFPVHPAFGGRAAGEDFAFRQQIFGLGKIDVLDKPFYRYRVRRGSHFDFFLDRATQQDGRIRVKYLSAEEANGSLQEARRQYAESVRELAVTRITESLTTSLAAAVEFLRLQGSLAQIEGYLHELEGFTLYWLAGYWPLTGGVVEIGSFKGRSTCWLASGCKLRGSDKVVAVDHFRGSPEHGPGGSHADPDIAATGSTKPAFEANLRHLNLSDWVEARVGSSAEISRTWEAPLRLLFIDGDHSYEATAEDFRLWSGFVVCRGLIVFHDVGVWPGVTKFYQELCQDREHYRELARIQTLGVLEKLG